MTNSPLIIFDSGIGGLSILKEFLYTDVPLLYFADSLNFPYGDKKESWLKQRLGELAELFKAYQPIGVVLACNTGTVSSIDQVRKALSCPVFGVEPVVKMLVHHHHPVVWATKVTLSSTSASNLRSELGQHVRYYTPIGLASAIESQDLSLVRQILERTKTELGEADAIGLSCTHYPLIKAEIQKVFPGVTLYDPSRAVATHVIKSLNLINLSAHLPAQAGAGHKSSIINHKITFVSTKDMLRLKRIANAYLYDNSTIFSK